MEVNLAVLFCVAVAPFPQTLVNAGNCGTTLTHAMAQRVAPEGSFPEPIGALTTSYFNAKSALETNIGQYHPPCKSPITTERNWMRSSESDTARDLLPL